MQYVTLDEDGKITAHYCGQSVPDGALEVPDNFVGRVGMYKAELTDDLTAIRPLSERVADGLVEQKDGYKISDDDTEFRRMSLKEIKETYDPVYIAKEGEYTGLKIWKWFNKDGDLELTMPDGYTEMSGEQPSLAYKAENGEWVFDLDRAKELKVADIKNQFNIAAANAHCTSSLGFEMDANATANRNIEGLCLVMEDGDTTLFRDYNNEYQTVTKEQLEIMRKEIVVSSQDLYQKKWTMEAAVDAAETEDDINNITVSFDDETTDDTTESTDGSAETAAGTDAEVSGDAEETTGTTEGSDTSGDGSSETTSDTTSGSAEEDSGSEEADENSGGTDSASDSTDTGSAEESTVTDETTDSGSETEDTADGTETEAEAESESGTTDSEETSGEVSGTAGL